MRPAVFLFLLALGCRGELTTEFHQQIVPGTLPPGYNNLASDGRGNSYVIASNGDAQITKIDSRGRIVYTRQIGGKTDDEATAITADANGNVWIAGSTNSVDFPTTVTLAAPPPARSSSRKNFLLKLNPAGRTLYAVIIPYFLDVRAIATDSQGAAYLTGSIYDSFSSTPGAVQSPGPGTNAFVLKVSPAGDRLVWSTALGGSIEVCKAENSCPQPSPLPNFSVIPTETEAGLAIAVDSRGNVYVGGVTNDVDFPVTRGAFQIGCNCHGTGTNGFAAKISADGSTLLYSTYLGGSSGSSAQAVALTDSGELWIAGASAAPFPTTPSAALSSVPAGSGAPGFLARVNSDGSGLQTASYLTASASVSSVKGIALRDDGSVIVAAITTKNRGLALGFDAGAGTLLFSNPLARSLADRGFAGAKSGVFTTAGATGVVTRFRVLDSNAPSINALTDSATVTARTQLATGELVTLYGERLGPDAGVATSPVNGFLPVQAGGTQVFFDGIPAPLLYVSAGQVNAVVPYEIAGHSRVNVQVVNASGSTSAYYQTAPSDPSIVEDESDVTLVFNQDGTRNSSGNPAAPGSVVSVYATGGGLLSDTAGETGKITTGPGQLRLPVAVEFQRGTDIVNAQITYAGPALETVSGLLQVGFYLPANFSGTPAFDLRIGDAKSRQEIVWIK